MRTLRLSTTLAGVILMASPACAGVIDLNTALGPSGRYTNHENYQRMLGQPMTATQQAYADQQDQLRQLGFLLERDGDVALGQMFYWLAYGITPPQSSLGLSSGGDPSLTPNSLVDGSPHSGNAGSGSADSVVTLVDTLGDAALTLPMIAVPEAPTWTMGLLAFAALGFVGYSASRKTAAAA